MRNVVTVINEQIYRNIETNAVTQIREELSDGSIEWLRPDGSVWDGRIGDPSSVQMSPPTKAT